MAARRVIMMQVYIIQSFDYNMTIHWINGVEAAKQNFQIKSKSHKINYVTFVIVRHRASTKSHLD